MEVSGLAKASDGITPAVGSTLEQQRGVAPASAHYACRVAQETATEFQQIEKVLDGLEQSGSLEVGMIFELGIGRQPFVIAAIMEMPSNTGRVFRLAEAGSGRVITMMRDASNTSRTLPGSVGKAPLVQDAAAAAGSSQPSGSLLGTIEYWASGLIPRDEDVKKRAKVAAELAPTSQQSIKASIKHIRSGGWAEDLAAEMPAHACGAEFTTSYAPSVMNRLAELYCVLLEEHDQNERKALAGVLEKLFSALSKVPFIKNDQIVFSRLSNLRNRTSGPRGLVLLMLQTLYKAYLGNTSALDLASPLDQTVWSRGSSVIEVVEILVGARQFRSSRA
jgi:hypothetical protein